jgi:transposase
MREQERQAQSDLDLIEKFRKREIWADMGLDYDEMMRREAAKPKEVVTVLANNKGVWYRDRSVWKKTTRPPKK